MFYVFKCAYLHIYLYGDFCTFMVLQKLPKLHKVIFLAHLYKSTENCCCHFDVSVSIGVGVTLQSFTSKFFYVMGKALSGKLSCTGTALVLFNKEVESFTFIQTVNGL